MGLLGHILALRANRSYEELVVERICNPLGMKDTRYPLSPERSKRLAKGHNAKGEMSPNWDFQALSGCGSLRSSANDMLTYAAAHLGLTPSKLQPALEACHQPRREWEGRKGYEIGLAWIIVKQSNPDVKVLAHSGGTMGYHCNITLVKDRQIGIVVMTNSSPLAGGNNLPGKIPDELLKVLAGGVDRN